MNRIRTFVLIGMVCLLALAGCGGDGDGGGDAAREPTPDVAYSMRWWNALSPEQMVAALFGDEATMEQETAAKKMYADLDDDTKALVNAAADEIYDLDAYASVGDWWETLDCRLMRIAAGDGITADPMSPYCAHYPGSGFAKILSDEAKAHVDYVGMALLDRDDPGRFIPYVGKATHGIGTSLAYVRVSADGSEPHISWEYVGYGMHRGRHILMVKSGLPYLPWPCATEYWDLETGNRAACLDANGAVTREWVPHDDKWQFPIMVGIQTAEYGALSPDDDAPYPVTETWEVEECGIVLEVVAGTFMVCRQVFTGASWDPNDTVVEWIQWYDPENDLIIKANYQDSSTELTVSELSAYDLLD